MMATEHAIAVRKPSRKWPELHSKVIHAYQQGERVRAIMARFGVKSPSTFYKILRVHRVKHDRLPGRKCRFSERQRKEMNEARKAGATLKALGKKYRVPFQTIHRLTGGKQRRKFRPINPWGE
jgi:transposase-like protein